MGLFIFISILFYLFIWAKSHSLGLARLEHAMQTRTALNTDIHLPLRSTVGPELAQLVILRRPFLIPTYLWLLFCFGFAFIFSACILPGDSSVSRQRKIVPLKKGLRKCYPSNICVYTEENNPGSRHPHWDILTSGLRWRGWGRTQIWPHAQALNTLLPGSAGLWGGAMEEGSRTAVHSTESNEDPWRGQGGDTEKVWGQEVSVKCYFSPLIFIF